jgi:hypothetical protein
MIVSTGSGAASIGFKVTDNSGAMVGDGAAVNV